MSNLRKKRVFLLTFLFISLAITSFLVGGSVNNKFFHQFNIQTGYFQPYQIGLPSTASASVTPTIEVTKNSDYSLIVWLLTEQGYSLLKDGLWFGNESIAKYDFGSYLSFQQTFAPGDTNYLVLDACGLPKNASSVTGTVRITTPEGLSTSMSSSNIIIGFPAIITIPVLLLITPTILRARKKDQE